MPRFYVDFALSPDSVVELPDNVVRHLNVLRVKNTEEIVLFNGNGKAYPALPEVLEKRRASVRSSDLVAVGRRISSQSDESTIAN